MDPPPHTHVIIVAEEEVSPLPGLEGLDGPTHDCRPFSTPISANVAWEAKFGA